MGGKMQRKVNEKSTKKKWRSQVKNRYTTIK